ncbi:MAG: hypothetical protein GVY31_07195 [Alphaproteobacteria bacterium]|jgi:hypothetical protein|nr:hypothetical protein [Alphaproteobacteria bacterium]
MAETEGSTVGTFRQGLKGGATQVGDTNLALLSADVGFFAMLSLFPALAALIAMMNLIADLIITGQGAGQHACHPSRCGRHRGKLSHGIHGIKLPSRKFRQLQSGFWLHRGGDRDIDLDVGQQIPELAGHPPHPVRGTFRGISGGMRPLGVKLL